MFTSEDKETHVRHVSGGTCLKDVCKFNMTDLQHNQKPQNSSRTTTVNLLKLKCKKWHKSHLTFECLKIKAHNMHN